MYPNLYFFFKDVFGVEIEGLNIVNSFGFFVALAFIAAAWVLTSELKRKQVLGLLSFTEQKIKVGAPAKISELIINFLLGFFLGFKIIGSFFITNAFNDPQQFIFSTNGNWPIGMGVGALLAFLKWREANQQKLAVPEDRIIRIWPHDRVGDMVVYAAIFGFSGAKLFDILEAPASFFQSLKAVQLGRENALSLLFSGLTFYGGLIVATIAIIFYAKKNKIGIIHLADAIAPAMMLAYAIGRIGCHVSGDGDWGVVNSAFISNATGNAIVATTQQYTDALQTHQTFILQKFGAVSQIPHHAVQPFLGLPNWMFAYTYPHNVVGDGVQFANCTGPYCAYLPLPVFPTPLYEIITCTILFFVLWWYRKKIKIPGQMAGLYLIFNGTERFLIEKIRVNTKYHFGSIAITQAEIISFMLIILGVLLFTQAKKWKLINS